MLTFDFGVLASAGEKLINAAGANPGGALIVVGGALLGLLIWALSKK